MSRAVTVFVIFAAEALFSVHARADGPQASSQADALFTEGRELLEKGRFAEACPKLARSEELAPAVGTLLNLGYCWEQTGKLRSAMDAYAEAEVLASSANDAKRAAFAKERFASVEPRAPRLVIRVPPPETPGLEIRRNGTLVPKTDFDKPLAIDPEDYVVTASAPGHAPWRGAFVVRGEGSVLTMIVPPLAPMTKANDKPAPAPMPTRRVAAIGLGVAGGIALGSALGLGLTAKARYDDSSSHCNAAGCDAAGNDIQRRALEQGNFATAFLGLSLLCTAAAAFLWFVGPSEKTSTGAVATKSSAASLLGGRF